jgi:sarcosine oxidase/L-pipecolate oxidase
VQRYRNLPIYQNFSTGWFCFPPHEDTSYLKCAIHGKGYTRTTHQGQNFASLSEEKSLTVPQDGDSISSPPAHPVRQRKNFTPDDGSARLHSGLSDYLPELAERKFERTAICWYTDTPTGDFVIDYHPDYNNLLMATGGSGQYVSVIQSDSVELLAY